MKRRVSKIFYMRTLYDNSLLGFGVMKVGLPGINPFSMERIAFSSPDMPAAGSE